MESTATFNPPIRKYNAWSWLNDARHFQIIYLSIFLVYGIAELQWDFRPNIIFTIIGTSLFTQALCCLIFKKPFDSLKSAAITSLGLSLLLKTELPWVAMLAAFLAISSKFIIKVNGKHLFNPANFGIIVTILLTHKAWISPGQWGNSAILLYFFGAAGFMLLFKVGRIDTGLTFLFTLFILEYAYSMLYLGWPADYLFHKFSSGALLLYSFFMITDPMTTPNHPRARIVWSVLVAVISFLLMNFKYMQGAAIWVLFYISPFTILFDLWMKGKLFEWNPVITLKTQK